MNTITISGQPGSGKSTVAELLAQHTNIPYINSGMLFRQQAKKYHMTLEAFGKYCETHPEVDKELDNHQLKLLQKGNIILEGRIAGWIAFQHNIQAVKIIITTDIDTRAQRIVKREQGEITQRKQEILKREKSEKKRYQQYYNINLDDHSIYNVCIDSSDKTVEEIVEIIKTHLP